VQEEPVEYPGQNQIIVLAQYRSVLRELYKRIAQSGLATVGYYVGGMKQSDLNISTGKQIVLATYSMASEGLDVATLSTLVFATPRTDIKQSVGRILRRKHARFPVVVDVVDTHATFKNQASKRKTYYRSNGYDIWKCSYGGYLSGGMKGVGGSGPSGTGKWSLVFRAAAVAAAPAKGDAGGRGQSATVVPDSDEEDGDTRSGPNYRTMDCFILRHKK
jgi:hypothetical protein